MNVGTVWKKFGIPLTVLSLFAYSDACFAAASLMQCIKLRIEAMPSDPRVAELNSKLTALRDAEAKVYQDLIVHQKNHYKRFISDESVRYIRRAVNLPDLTADQAQELYFNNLYLFLDRTSTKADEVFIQKVFTVTPLSEMHASVSKDLASLSKQLGTDLQVTEEDVGNFVKKAITINKLGDLSPDDSLNVVKVRALQRAQRNLVELNLDLDKIVFGTTHKLKNASENLKNAYSQYQQLETAKKEITSKLDPSISVGLNTTFPATCCKAGTCRPCPVSLALKHEIKKSHGVSFNVILKEITGVAAPAELPLFRYKEELNAIVPGNW